MDSVEKLQGINRKMLDEMDEEDRPKHDDSFDHFPQADDTAVPLRRHLPGPDGHDHLDWYMASGDGEIEGTEVAVRCGMQCNTEITFYPEGENRDQSIRKYTYRIDVQDLIKHAHGQFKRDRLKEGK